MLMVKDRLDIIGKYRQQKSFPRRFEPLRDLGMNYYPQNNSCNNKVLWASKSPEPNRSPNQEVVKFLHLMYNNCYAHAIDDYVFPNIVTQRFTPCTSEALKYVYIGIGRSFKSSY